MKKIICALLVLVLSLGLFAGCSGQPAATGTPTATPTPASSQPSPENKGDEIGEDPYLENVPGYKSADVLGPYALPGDIPPSRLPLTDGGETLEFWITAPSTSSNLLTMADGYMWIEVKKLTGVDISFIHPVANAAREQFSLVVASGEYFDIMASGYYTGGIEKAVLDNVYVDLNQYKELAPHLFGMLYAKPELYKDVLSDGGYLGHFPHFDYAEDFASISYLGPVVRKDYLDKYGIQKPETFDEYHDMLVTFKDNGSPNSMFLAPTGLHTFNAYLAGLGLTYTYAFIDGKVDYSPVRSDFKTYLEIMNSWYEEDLILRDYYTYSSDWEGWMQIFDDNILTMSGYAAFGGDHYAKTGEATDPNFFMTGLKNPVLNKGDYPTVYNTVPYVNARNGFAVTATSKHIELAVRYLDFFYSSEGVLLANYGAPDVGSYYYGPDDRPLLSELVTEDEIMDLAAAFDVYSWHVDAPYCIHQREMDTFTEVQQEIVKTWAEGLNRDTNRKMPVNYTLTSDESDKVTALMADIDTYVKEWTTKFIIGAEPLDKFDDYVAQVMSMGLGEVLELQQTAVDRYFARGS